MGVATSVFGVLFGSFRCLGVTALLAVPPAFGEPLRDLLAGEEDLSVFASAMRQSGVLERVESGTPYVLFVATDAALEAEGSAFLLNGVMLDQPNAERLEDLMALHVAVGSHSLADVIQAAEVWTLEGSCMPIYAVEGRLRIGPEAFVTGERAADDGTLYVIDRLLWRPYRGAHPCGPALVRPKF